MNGRRGMPLLRFAIPSTVSPVMSERASSYWAVTRGGEYSHLAPAGRIYVLERELALWREPKAFGETATPSTPKSAWLPRQRPLIPRSGASAQIPEPPLLRVICCRSSHAATSFGSASRAGLATRPLAGLASLEPARCGGPG